MILTSDGISKFLVVVLSLVLSPSALFAESDFRNSSWGDTEEQVRKVEQSKSVDLDTNDSKGALVYQADVSGYQFKLNYTFDGSKQLRMSSYSYQFEKLNIGTFKSMKTFFIKFEKLLSAKYGKWTLPNADDDIGLMSNSTTVFPINVDLVGFLMPIETNSSDLADFANDGKIQKIIDADQCRFSLKWETDRTVIVLEVQGSSETIYYFEKSVYKWLNDQQKRTQKAAEEKDLGSL